MSAQRLNGLGSCKAKRDYSRVGFDGEGTVIRAQGIESFSLYLRDSRVRLAKKGGTADFIRPFGGGFFMDFYGVKICIIHH